MRQLPPHTATSVEYYEPAARVFSVGPDGKPLDLIDIIDNGDFPEPYSCLLCETDFRNWAEAAHHLKRNGVTGLAVKS